MSHVLILLDKWANYFGLLSKNLPASGASPPDPLIRGSAPGPARWGYSPQTSNIFPPVLAISPPNLGCLDKTLILHD